VLSVYTRHYPPCSKTDIHYGRCQCPKWIRGLLENTGAVRVSARTRSWHQAEGKSRVMEQADAGWVTLERAVEAYIKDDEGPQPESSHRQAASGILGAPFSPLVPGATHFSS
jgi:hypothetical protein